MSLTMTKRKAGMTAEAFSDLLKAAKLTQEQAAEALGVDRRTVGRWARGQVTISVPYSLLIRTTIKPRKK